MHYMEYMKFEIADGGPLQLPEFFFADDLGEEPDLEMGLAILCAEGYFYNNDPEKPTYGEELEEDYPEVYRMLQIIANAQRQQLMDELVEAEFVDAVFEDGEIIYRWNEKGVAMMNEVAQELEDESDSAN